MSFITSEKLPYQKTAWKMEKNKATSQELKTQRSEIKERLAMEKINTIARAVYNISDEKERKKVEKKLVALISKLK